MVILELTVLGILFLVVSPGRRVRAAGLLVVEAGLRLTLITLVLLSGLMVILAEEISPTPTQFLQVACRDMPFLDLAASTFGCSPWLILAAVGVLLGVPAHLQLAALRRSLQEITPQGPTPLGSKSTLRVKDLLIDD